MAVIDFKCKTCGHAFFEIVQSKEQRDAVTCPECGGPVKQMFQGTANVTGPRPACGGNCGSCGGCGSH